jgi:hypothetical protein
MHHHVNAAMLTFTRRLLPRLLVAGVATLLALGFGEILVRCLPAPVTPSMTCRPEDFIARLPFSDERQKEWFLKSPPPLGRKPILPEHIQRYEQAHQAMYCCCVFNEHFLRQDAKQLAHYLPWASQVDRIDTFQAPWGSPHPPFRFYPGVTTPCGLTTNRFGFRGPEIELNKPARTIRIACVGASTTVGLHSDPHSYPEMLQHWLNRWSSSRGLGLTFEVINAGRSGITSRHIAAVVRYEVLPLNVDYVLYYEGNNSFNPLPVLKYHQREGEHRAVDVLNGTPEPQGVCDWIAQYSELARRCRSFLRGPAGTLREPSKPRQRIIWPTGLDEQHPDRDRLGSFLNLSSVLGDLEQIDSDSRSAGARMIMTSFYFLIRDGMQLERSKHMGIYNFYNERLWPITYANFERLAVLQNRVFRDWAQAKGLDFIDVAGQMPWAPDLFFDGIHNYELGHRVRAWIIFQALLPVLERDLREGTIPVRQQPSLAEHPYINSALLGSVPTMGLVAKP